MSATRRSSALPRRAFLRGTAASVGALVLPRVSAAAIALSFQPAVFDVGPDSAIVWVSGDSAGSIAIELGPDENLLMPRRAAVAALDKASDFTVGWLQNFGLVRVDPLTGKAAVEFVDGDGRTLHTLEFTA